MSDYTDYLEEVFAQFGEVEARRMFGGHGLFHGGLMFGLVADDMLYLKADEASAGAFEARGLARFHYEKGGRQVSLSYYMAPAELFDDPDEAVRWARAAYDAALRASQATPPAARPKAESRPRPATGPTVSTGPRPDASRRRTKREVRAGSTAEPRAERRVQAEPKPKPESKATAKPEAKAGPGPEAKREAKARPEPKAKPKAKATTRPGPKAGAESKRKAKATAKPKPRAESKPRPRSAPKPRSGAPARHR